MRLSVLAAVAVICAGAANAQIQIGRGQFERPLRPSVPEHCRMSDAARQAVDAEYARGIKTAQAALGRHDGAAALDAISVARPSADHPLLHAALTQVEVAAYSEIGNEPLLIQRLEAALLDDCIAAPIRKNYRQMLDTYRAGQAARQQQ